YDEGIEKGQLIFFAVPGISFSFGFTPTFDIEPFLRGLNNGLYSGKSLPFSEIEIGDLIMVMVK
ncbi:hypothetical protein, partial [Eubacterium barkeri]|uniref:hypothetical protein n=1 Tax=Eubacterium barkeri TaxID=1528 RepID=UPI0015A30CEC